MRQDRIALHGFGKMFKKFWQIQIENTENLSNFILLRGGIVETPFITVRSLFNKIDYFKNESSTIAHLLSIEFDHTKTSRRLYSLSTEIDPVVRF